MRHLSIALIRASIWFHVCMQFLYEQVFLSPLAAWLHHVDTSGPTQHALVACRLS